MKKKSLFIVVMMVLLTLGLGLKSVQAAEVTNEEKTYQQIKKTGTLRVGLSPDYPPFEYVTQKNGKTKYIGADVELAKKIATDLGVDLKIVPMDFSALLTALQSGKIDLVISGISYTEERAKSVDFSKEYFQNNQVILIGVNKASKYHKAMDFSNGNGTLTAQQGSLQEQLIKEQIPSAKLLSMQQVTDEVNAVLSGQADGAVMDYSSSDAFLAANEGNLKRIDAQFDDEQSGVYVLLPKNEPTLKESVNQTIDEVVQKKVFPQWIKDAQDQSVSTQKEQQKINWLDYAPYYINGVKMTILLSFFGGVIGIVLGSLLAVMRLVKNPIISGIATAYVEFVRGTPMMVQVLFMFLGVGAIFSLSNFVAGLIAIGLNSGAYVCEIIRGGLQAVDKGQEEAARSLGLSALTTLKKIIFPQALRTIWPALGNEFVTLIKESSVVSVIGLADLTFQTRAVTSLTYQGIIPLFISMVLYFILTFVLTKVMNQAEKRMNAKY